MKNKLFSLTTFLAVIFLFSSCKLSQMIKAAEDNKLVVDPNPLEVHADKVDFNISADLPPKVLPKNTSFSIKAVYVYGDKELEVGTVDFSSYDFPNSATTESSKSANFSFPYQEGMNPGKLYLEATATDDGSGKSKTMERFLVATGLKITSKWVVPVSYGVYVEHGYNDREEIIPINIDFQFEKGKSKLKPSLAYDGTSNEEKINQLDAFIAEKNITRTVTITGTHSPEGSETINSDLSGNRAETIEKYYRAQMEKYDYAEQAEEINFITKPVVQDWSEFKTLLEENDISDEEKEVYVSIINGTGTFVEKEKEFHKLPSYSNVSENIYPTLRAAKTEVLTVKKKKTKAEIAILAKAVAENALSDDTLSTEELMYGASLTPSLEEKLGIYKAVIKKSDSWNAHNNLAVVYMKKAKEENNKLYLEDAMTHLDIANNKIEDAFETQTNIASVKIAQGNYDEGYDMLSELKNKVSNDISTRINSMRGSIEATRGEYEKANLSFAASNLDDETRFNKGLSNLLSKQYEVALNDFESIESLENMELSSEASYLAAITSARLNRPDGIKSNLKKAFEKNADLKGIAASDLEFSKFASIITEVLSK